MRYLEGCGVDDGARRLGEVPLLGEGGAGVGGGAPRQDAALAGELLRERGRVVLDVPVGGGEVIVWRPRQGSTQTAHLHTCTFKTDQTY